MPDIRHRVVVSVPLEATYDAVASRSGVAGWWTRDIRGASAVGEQLEFFFGGPEPAAVMQVVRLDPAGQVAWRCVAGADEWVGTTVTFDLTACDGETVVLFTHGGWCDPSEFMAHCSARWAYFLLSLKAYLESGKGTPAPDDLKF
jgi:Activator of Hsp90 ATPase homolog 1-like protein